MNTKGFVVKGCVRCGGDLYHRDGYTAHYGDTGSEMACLQCGRAHNPPHVEPMPIVDKRHLTIDDRGARPVAQASQPTGRRLHRRSRVLA